MRSEAAAGLAAEFPNPRLSFFALTVLTVLFYIASLAIVLQFTEEFIYSVYAYVDAHDIVLAQLPEDLYRRLQMADFIRIFATYFLALLAIFFEVIAFYNLKLKIPLRLLRDAAARMAHNDLGFTLSYPSRDEMGDLCRMFESTRAQLEENHRELWRAIEERKRLNAAFAHDLRTPLTVLRGYVDFLAAYVPQGKVREEKASLHPLHHVKPYYPSRELRGHNERGAASGRHFRPAAPDYHPGADGRAL